MRLKRLLVPACVGLLAAPLAVAEVELTNDDEKTLYTFGVALARNLAPFEFAVEDLQLIQAGLLDGALGNDLKVEPTEFAGRIDGMLQARIAEVTEREKQAGAAFLAERAKEEGAETLPSGLIYVQLSEGTGATPGPTDTVSINYHGTLRDGEVFDSTREGDSPGPVNFRVDGVIPCFGEALQKMKIGGRSKVTCPAAIAYGDRGSPPSIRPGATIAFEIELLAIEEPAAVAVPGATP